MKKLTYNLLFACILIFLFVSNAFAATKTTSQSGNWSATTTWGGSSAPVAGDVVIIDGGSTVTVDIPNATCLSVQLGGSSLGTGTGTLTFTNGSHVIISGALNIGPFNNNGTSGSLNMTSGGTLSCESIIVGKLGTWTEGTGTIEFTATNTVPSNSNINFNNLVVSGGICNLSKNVTVNGNLLINSGGTLDCGTITLTLLGNYTNNGTFIGNAGLLSFDKNGNQTITGTGINNFNFIKVNMGTSVHNTLEVLSSNFNAPDAFLTLTNGTFKMSGTFTFVNTFFAGPIYNIQPETGLWINNSKVTVVGQTGGGASIRGLLRLSSGTINIGVNADNSLNYVAGSEITIEGGSLNIAGNFTRNNATATTVYTQTGGTVTVVGQGSTDPTFAGFDLGAVGSSFTMSGGSIVIRNATSDPSDFLNASAVTNVTGGTLQIGDAITSNAQTIRIQSSFPVANLLISNATSQMIKPTAQLVSSSLNVNSNVTIQSGTTLNTNGFNLILGGNWSNNGTFTSGGNTVTFNGISAQSIINSGGETFNNLTVSKTSGTLTLSNSVLVNNTFSLTQGTMVIGSNTLTLNGMVTGGGLLTSSSAGTTNYNQGSDGQNVLAANYGNLIFSNFNKTLASTGNIGVAGIFTPGTGAGHMITGSTFEFNGGAQSIPAFNYNNLILSGNGTKSGSNLLTVTGNFTNNMGIIFSVTTSLNLNGITHLNYGSISVSALYVGSGSTLTNNGIIKVDSILTGNGTFTQGETAILNIGGKAEISMLNASASGNTVNYTGTSQTLIPATYYHLTLSGSGTPILTGKNSINGNFSLSGTVSITAVAGMTIGGNFTIGAGTSFNASTFSHTIKGNLNNAGTFDAETSTITMSGASSQTINATAFNNLSINNTFGVTMVSDEIINSTLNLTSGAFSIGAHTLTLNGAIAYNSGSLVGESTSNISILGSDSTIVIPGIMLNNLTLNRISGASIKGDVTINGQLTITKGILVTGDNSIILGVNGNLSETSGQPVFGNVSTMRNITSTSGTESFGNIGAEIALNGKALGSITILRKTGTVSSGNGHNSIKRYFEITPTTNSGLNADLVFHYDTSEISGQNVNSLELYKSQDNGTTWKNQGGIVDTISKTIVVKGVNDFSRWTASDTTNFIGNTTVPTITNTSPSAKTIGNAAFTLTINGTNFINGKSIVRFNGENRITTFINSTQMTAQITASDLLVAGTFPITIFNLGGGGLSNVQMFTVNLNKATQIRLETAADGSGTVISDQMLASGSSITLFAITRDVLDNFVANFAADAWTVVNITGGVIANDLVPSIDRKSAVFTGHVAGTASISASSGSLTKINSGTITVVASTNINEATQTFGYKLMQNHPNPFSSSTTISYQNPNYGHVIFKVLDINGREVVTLVNEVEEAGSKTLVFDASNLKNGVYFYRLQIGNYFQTKKMILER